MSEVLLSEVKNENKSFRFDSEYFKKEYLIDDIILHKYRIFKLGELSFITDGQHGYHEIDENSNIHMLTAKNAKTWFANLEGAEPLAKWVDDKNKRSSLQDKDIILSTRGTVGCCALVVQEILPANIDQDIARIKLETNDFKPEFLIAYLNSKFGYDWMIRNQTGMVQQGLSLEKVRTFPIPRIPLKFQQKIETMVQLAYQKLQQEKKLYSQAENLLLCELGLENFNPSNEKVSIKSLKESFLKTGRLDSEYYQPKYEVMEKKLDKIGVEKLESICSLINYGTVPTSPYVKNNNSVPYIKGMNLKNCFVVGELDEIENTDNLQDKFFTKENDIIISQMGTVGDVGIVTKEQENYLFASFTIRARLDDDRFNPFFVGAYIQNVAKEYYLYRNIAQASVRQNTDLPTIKNMPIPMVKKEVQDEIAGYIKQSMEYSKKAKELLKISTKSVEIAIDKDEQAAHNFLDRQTDRQTDGRIL